MTRKNRPHRHETATRLEQSNKLVERRKAALATAIELRDVASADHTRAIENAITTTPAPTDLHVATLFAVSESTVRRVRAQLVAAGRITPTPRRRGRPPRTY